MNNGFRPLTGIVLFTLMKYYREIRSRPPYGDGAIAIESALEVAMFSPPYGDSTKMCLVNNAVYMFSPPYGDCIRMTTPKYPVMELSPPYGDGTLNISQNIVKWKS